MTKRGTVTVLAVLAVGAVGVTPALATSAKHKPKDLKGSWSFTDATPDETPTALGEAGKREGFCTGTLPSAPTDVNTQKIKVTGPGTLTVLGHNTGDWASELRDAKGKVLTGSDGTGPNDAEGFIAALRKPGTYSVVFCNLAGVPAMTADYTYKYR